MKLPAPLAQSLVPAAAAAMIRALHATMKIRCLGCERLDDLRRAGRAYIHAFWHAHLLLMPYAYPGGKIAILISEHRDGEYIARTMERFGHTTVRGSTTSGGAAALREVVRLARQGYDLGFTPDGPRGPRCRAQSGVVAAARLSGHPILPVAFAGAPAREMGSWDRFVVPYPFSRGVFAYGPPIEVDSEADEAAMEKARLQVEDELNACTADAGEAVKDPGRFASLSPLPRWA